MASVSKSAIQNLITQFADGAFNTAAELRGIATALLDSTVHNDDAVTFETISKNTAGYPVANTYTAGGFPLTDTFTTPNGDIVKTYAYVSDNLVSITLSGAGLPAGVITTKTFTYTGDNQSSVAYS